MDRNTLVAQAGSPSKILLHLKSSKSLCKRSNANLFIFEVVLHLAKFRFRVNSIVEVQIEV